MSEHPTREEVLASIVPKSDQLNADDLLTGPITVTITKVSRGDREQPIIVEIEGHRPYKPCKTMRRVLIASYTDDPHHWVGQQMTLYCDPNVTWAGVKVGGIRISHLSGLKEPKTFLLTQTRGKKSEVTIFPLKTISPEEQTYIDDAKGKITGAETAESLKAVGFILKKKSEAIQAALRPVYVARQKELMEP
ncbi:MAG: hypothetical protein ABIH23_34805 [bacterium]